MPASAPDPATPLWRAAQVFRLLSCIYALGFQIAINDDLDRPAIGWLLFAVLIAWSVACAVAYLKGFGRRPAWVLAELAIVVALMLSTEFVASEQWALNNQSWPTTLWATNATISAAILLGPIYGMLSGVVIVAASTVAKGVLNYDLGRNATVVIELAVGLGVGMAAQTARRAHADLERAARLAARTEERERLSRQVHDGAIQVLALVSRRGREIGGETAELAELAGEQERALRRLVSSADAEPRVGELTDVGALLRRRASDRVSVSVPADPVLLDANRRRRAVCGGGQRARQRGRACGAGRARLRAVGGSRRLGHGEHSRRRCRDPGRPAGGSRRRGQDRDCQINCGADELAGWQREAEHRAGMRDGMGTDDTPTVMVVDDHPIWRDAVARDLADDGFNVVATADGVASARRRAAVVQPNVVVMDMRLPDGDGAQATAEVLDRFAVVEDPGALRLRRARRRAGGREGRRHRISGQECVQGRTR